MPRGHFAPLTHHGHIIAPAQQGLPVVTSVTLAPASSGGSLPVPGTTFETTSGPAVRVVLTPVSGGASSPPPAVFTDFVVNLAPASSGASLPLPVISLRIPVPPQPVVGTWQRDVQRWAVHQERQRHVQALWQYGELAVFVLMWTVLDLQAGMVGRCQRCFLNTLSTPVTPVQSIADVGGNATLRGSEAQIAAAYGVGNQYLCTDCFGTQFEGGFRAMIVRPAIFTDVDKNQQRSSKGVVNPAQVAIETTPDFWARTGDYCFRQDGNRFQLRVPKRTTLRTGFATPYQSAANINYNLMQAGLEDPNSVAYIMPPTQQQITQVLGTYSRLTVDLSSFEIVRAPLLIEEAPSPASSGSLQPNASFTVSS